MENKRHLDGGDVVFFCSGFSVSKNLFKSPAKKGFLFISNWQQLPLSSRACNKMHWRSWLNHQSWSTSCLNPAFPRRSCNKHKLSTPHRSYVWKYHRLSQTIVIGMMFTIWCDTPSHHPFLDGIFPYKPTIWGFGKPPNGIVYNHIDRY